MPAGLEIKHRLLPILAGQAFGLACGVAGISLTTALVPPDVLGPYSLFLSFAPVGMWAIHAGVIKFTARHWAEAPDPRSMLRQMAGASLRKLPWLVLAGAAGAGLIGSLPVLWLAPILVMTAALLSWATIAQTALQAAREHWRDAGVLAASSVTRSFLPPLLYAGLGGSALALPAGYAAHALIFALAGSVALASTLRRRDDRAAAVPPVPEVYEGPLFIGLALTGWILLGLGRWVVAWSFGPVETGLFSLASNLATLVPAVLGTIFLLYVQPSLFAAPHGTADERRRLAQRADRVALLHALASLAGLVALRLLLPSLVGTLIGERYAGAVERILPAGGLALAITTGQFYHSLLLAGRRESACGPVELSAAAVLIVGSVVSALAGMEWLFRWMTLAPVVPWLVTRPLARRYLLL